MSEETFETNISGTELNGGFESSLLKSQHYFLTLIFLSDRHAVERRRYVFLNIVWVPELEHKPHEVINFVLLDFTTIVPVLTVPGK